MSERIQVTSGDKRNFTTLPNYLIRCGDAPNVFRVIAVIASYAWEGSHCTASVSKIAKDAGVTRHTVIDAIRTWQERKQIEVEKIEGVGMKIRTLFDYTLTDAPWNTSVSLSTAPVTTEAPLPVLRQAHKEDPLKTQEKDTTAFDAFWTAYPKHEGKKDAIKAWGKIKHSPELLNKILDAIAANRETRKWKEGFIKLPAGWLRGEHWNDEIDVETEKKIVEKKKKPFIDGDPAYKKGDDWYVITYSGDHCKYIGSMDKLVWK